METETLCHSKAIVVRGDSDSLRLGPAFKDLTREESVSDLKTPSMKQRPGRRALGRLRCGAGAELHGRKLEGDVCLVPHGSHLPLVRENRAIVSAEPLACLSS